MHEGSWRSDRLHDQPVVAPDFEVNPGESALLVVDMQYGSADRAYGLGIILSRDYPSSASYYYSRVENVVVPNIRSLLNCFRHRELRVVFLTIAAHLEDEADFPRIRRHAEGRIRKERGVGTSMTVVGSKEQEILTPLKPLPTELVLNKVTRSAFHSTGIDTLLRNMGITTLIITGVGTNACVGATAVDAADIGYKCVLVEDACATPSKYLHDATLANFALLYGAVMTTQDVLAAVTCKT